MAFLLVCLSVCLPYPTMPESSTEVRTYVGQTGILAFDGMAGFRIGQLYDLAYTRDILLFRRWSG
jgi:hypothetical protein